MNAAGIQALDLVGSVRQVFERAALRRLETRLGRLSRNSRKYQQQSDDKLRDHIGAYRAPGEVFDPEST